MFFVPQSMAPPAVERSAQRLPPSAYKKPEHRTLDQLVKDHIVTGRTNDGVKRPISDEISRAWEQTRVRIACAGLRITTAELEMELLEHGRHLVDGYPRCA